MIPWIQELLTNPIFLSVVAVWLIAGIVKYVIGLRTNEGSFAWQLFRTGGMPSAHSGVVTTLIVSVFWLEGLSTLFFVTCVLGLIVIRDSFGVRWSVGQQAQIINKIIHHDHMHEHVKVVLGHTMKQAAAGIILGAVVAVIVHSVV